jgi:broad specificity phosphatase PhoE
MVLALGVAFFFESQATTTVIVVRHADVEAGLGDDLGLSPAGAIRAEELSRVLADVDVIQGLDAILVGGGRASLETAEPLARRLNLPVQEVDTASLTGLAKRIVKDYKGKIVLVVIEPAAIPMFIPRFQGSKNVPELADGEYDNLYVVSVPWYGKVKTLRFRYGARLAPASEANGLAARSPSAVSGG